MLNTPDTLCIMLVYIIYRINQKLSLHITILMSVRNQPLCCTAIGASSVQSIFESKYFILTGLYSAHAD